MVDLQQALSLCRRRRALHLVVARRERPVVVVPVDERVHDVAVGANGAPAEGALLALELRRLQRR